MGEIDKFYWNLGRAFVGMSTLLAIVGPIGNFMILLTTIKTSSMRTTCNFLIAMCAVGDILHQCGVIVVQLPILFNFHFEISSYLCNCLMFLPEMGITIGCVCVLLIGFDRLFSVIFAVSYKSRDKTVNHIAIAAVLFSSCLHVCYVMYAYYTPRIGICEILTPFADGLPYFTFPILAVNILSVLVYLIVWIRLRMEADAIMMKRIFKSLLIIVTVDASGWLITPFFIYLILHSALDDSLKFAWSYFGTNFINIALSIKIFVYYTT
ncbi:hypothetical protein PRIPAC_80085, partial [Pristionchus pacificus]|uniref:G protein-coupled receptor n=1 Tax=Pristionchus pacificus TaxID=54126 RepID=A0A2A6CKL4_PRIPA